MPRLRPCSSCARHVKVGEASCPFCATALGPWSAPARDLGRPASRAAVVFFGAAATVAACSSGGPDGPSSSSSGGSSGVTSSSSSVGPPAACGRLPQRRSADWVSTVFRRDTSRFIHDSSSATTGTVGGLSSRVGMNDWNSNQCANARSAPVSRANSRDLRCTKTRCNTEDHSWCYNIVGSNDDATILSSGISSGFWRWQAAGALRCFDEFRYRSAETPACHVG
jgi:hypothetical protein